MNPILARFQETPALLDETRGAWLEACASMAVEHIAAIEKQADSGDGDFWYDSEHYLSRYRPYNVKNGILFVPVRGLLVNNFPWQLGAWVTGYEYIRAAIKRGLDDSDVKGIVLVVESGGGMVSGNWDLVDYIFAARDIKPIRAVAAEYAYSAAYNIAAATSHITVARTGGVGSIGVIVTHFEYSEMLAADGIKVTFIRSKPHKAEGSAYEKLSEGARKRIQAEVDELHTQFVAMVARNRGMSEAAVDGTDAHTFMARQAIENGLADAIGTIDDAVSAFEASFSNEGEEPMADISQADHDAAVAAATESGRAEGRAEGIATGKAQALERINAIIGSDAGKARPKAAMNAALKTSMSAEEAVAFLDTLGAETAEAPANGAGVPAALFQAAMEGGNPNIGAEGNEKTTTTADEDRALIQQFGLAGFNPTK